MNATTSYPRVRGKIEQRVALVVDALHRWEGESGMSYKDLMQETGVAYDVLIYVLASLTTVGYVERVDVVPDGPGRPYATFSLGKEVGGSRFST